MVIAEIVFYNLFVVFCFGVLYLFLKREESQSSDGPLEADSHPQCCDSALGQLTDMEV